MIGNSGNINKTLSFRNPCRRDNVYLDESYSSIDQDDPYESVFGHAFEEKKQRKRSGKREKDEKFDTEVTDTYLLHNTIIL